MDNSTLQAKWQKCQQFIRDNIGESRYNTWFAKTLPLGFENDTITLQLPTHFYYEKYEDDFYNVLTSALRKEFGATVRLKYSVAVVQEGQGERVTLQQSGQSRIITDKLEKSTHSPADPNTTARGRKFDPQLNPTLNFENYCVSDSNILPVTIAQNIAEHPRNSDFNPFFLYGEVGVGKTHLIQAIGIRVKERNPNAKVLFTSLREFQHLYAVAVMNKSVPKFINWFMEMDVLLLDDLQEIEGKAKTSEALFPIFNHLHQNGKQLVFTCDRPPMELDGIMDRLIDRFKWGLTEKLQRPDAALRKKILTFKAAKNGLALDDNIIDFIAGNAVNSVRELEGVVMGLLTRSIHLNQPITLEMAREVMANTVRIPVKKNVNFEMIVETTAEYFNLSPDAIFSKNRMRDINDARQVIMYLGNKLTGLSSTVIGRKLNRGHGTVLHGIKNINERLALTTDDANEMARILHDIEADLLR